ncbi:MAG: hypothetical protein RL023_508, partial [Candidatus Parcubacteria bacterium]
NLYIKYYNKHNIVFLTKSSYNSLTPNNRYSDYNLPLLKNNWGIFNIEDTKDILKVYNQIHTN